VVQTAIDPDRAPEEAIALLEGFLGLSPTGTHCNRAEPVPLPFPLLEDDAGFLSDPSRPPLNLVLLYLGCGRPSLADRYLSGVGTTGSANLALLRAYLLVASGRAAEAGRVLAAARRRHPADAEALDRARALLSL
jgi:hypothetical protein